MWENSRKLSRFHSKTFRGVVLTYHACLKVHDKVDEFSKKSEFQVKLPGVQRRRKSMANEAWFRWDRSQTSIQGFIQLESNLSSVPEPSSMILASVFGIGCCAARGIRMKSKGPIGSKV